MSDDQSFANDVRVILARSAAWMDPYDVMNEWLDDPRNDDPELTGDDQWLDYVYTMILQALENLTKFDDRVVNQKFDSFGECPAQANQVFRYVGKP